MWDHELLAIKLALEEWCHFLEGAEHPFTIYTPHKNLTYLRMAKWLNACQACWSLFFDCLKFSISFRPVSKNTKADALSRQYEPDTYHSEPSPVRPAPCRAAFLSSSIEETIQQTLQD